MKCRRSMQSFQEKIAQFKKAFITALEMANTEQELESVRIMFLARKGQLALLMDLLKTASLEEKKVLGPLLNELKKEVENAFDGKKSSLFEQQIQSQRAQQHYFDVSATVPHSFHGTLHPLTQLREHIENIFISMGYSIADGPEVETEYYNFEALNIPADHPARDMWDTFWLDIPSLLLRTHTSSVQVHAMEKNKPPLAFVAPGRCISSRSN